MGVGTRRRRKLEDGAKQRKRASRDTLQSPPAPSSRVARIQSTSFSGTLAIERSSNLHFSSLHNRLEIPLFSHKQ